jgi:glycosyltransferase involved in cell wall biosynthesis
LKIVKKTRKKIVTGKEILMLTPRYSPAVGGVEKHVATLSRLLKRHGYRITILTAKHIEDLPSTDVIDGNRIIRLPFKWDKNPFLSYIWFLKNRKLIQSKSVIHIHDTMPFLQWYLPLRIIFRSNPVFLTFHGYEKDPVPKIFVILRKLARRLSRKVLCIGEFINKIYSVQCDMNSVGAVEYQRSVTQKRSGAVFVGRLERDTEIETYIESIHLLEKEKGVRMHLTLCGSGSIAKDLKEYANYLNVEIELLGIVKDPMKILSTKEICFAGGYLSILEANASGTPTIAISKSHLKNQYFKAMRKAGGIISIQSSAEGIMREISRLRENPSLVESISKAGIDFAKSMTWEAMLNLYLELWSTR